MSDASAAAATGPDAVTASSRDDEVSKLRLQVTQLKNIIKKLTGQEEGGMGKREAKSRAKKGARPFDHDLYKRRHVALQVAYFGWDYYGFAVQEIAGKTIESELFRALTLTKLIRDRESSNYHRCGRTDKGVSAFRQTVTLDLRSQLLEGPGVHDYEGCRAHEREKRGEEPTREIDFCRVLNSNLPDHIQVLAWAPCPRPDFSARFDCQARTYKYFFPLGGVSLERLNEGGQRLVGGHDYRNFCKMDLGNNVTNYRRRIDSVSARLCRTDAAPSSDPPGPYTMCELTVKGKAFLWHQIRCVVSVLFRVGDGSESPDVITDLLDIEKNPQRPQYSMATEIPLNLFDCQFDGLEWTHSLDALTTLIKRLQSLWAEHQVKATMLRTALTVLEDKHTSFSESEPVLFQNECLVPRNRTRKYIPLMEMDKCPSLETKMDRKSAKRQKLAEEPEDCQEEDVFHG